MTGHGYEEICNSQSHYRALLDGMARPGTIQRLEPVALMLPGGVNRASAYIAFALLDRETTFSALHSPEGTGRYFASHTQSREVEPGVAEFQFTEGVRAPEAIAETNAGTLLAPETGATVVIAITRISEEAIPNSLELALRGPGIEEESRLWVEGVSPLAFDRLQEKNQEYPAGIDVVLCAGRPDEQAKLVCIPRTTAVRWTF